MKFGSHISIRNGYFQAAKEAYRIGAKAFQYFPKNPRSLSIKVFDEKDADHCSVFCKENGIESIAHTPYASNLAVPEDKADDMVAAILNDLEIANACGSIGVVVHFGVSKNENDPLEGYRWMIHILNLVLSKWEGESKVLIENNAGKSGPMGTTLEELVQVRSLTDFPEKIGFCLDTCHAFASGIWNGDNWVELEAKGKELDYFTHLKAIHLNNSMYPTKSMRDRHANIHNGCITVEQMKDFILSKEVKDLPMVLETPSSAQFTHKDEIEFLKKLVGH